MSIELHCTRCSKLIRAPDNAGGQYGKCPYCQNRVYIPTPFDDNTELSLAPVDEADDRQAALDRQESLRLAAVLDHSDGAPAGTNEPGTNRPSERAGEVIDMPGEVKRFVLAMRDSKLDEAERAATILKKTGTRGRDYVQGLMVDEIPPDIEKTPPPLVQGFLKALLARLE